MRLTLALLLALLIVPATASATTAKTRVTVLEGKGCTLLPESCVIVHLDYDAVSGERNDVELTRDGADILVRDNGTTIQAGHGCKVETPERARCSPPEGPSTGIIGMEVSLGDLNDVLRNRVGLGTTLEAEGGAGDDQLFGGDGFDTLGGGAGVDRLFGGGGADHLGDGAGGTALEPDEIDGGDGEDRVSYARRTRRVSVNLATAGANAGEAGEGDSLSSVETVWGGAGPDLLRAGSAPVSFSGRTGNDKLVGGFGVDVLDGGSGDDRIDGSFGKDRVEGGKGNDRLRGGCDPDKVFGEAGRDRILDSDGSPDRIDGGADRDFAEYDQTDALRRIELRRFRRVDACAL